MWVNCRYRENSEFSEDVKIVKMTWDANPDTTCAVTARKKGDLIMDILFEVAKHMPMIDTFRFVRAICIAHAVALEGIDDIPENNRKELYRQQQVMRILYVQIQKALDEPCTLTLTEEDEEILRTGTYDVNK